MMNRHRLNWARMCGGFALLLAMLESPAAAQKKVTAQNLTDEHVRKAIATLTDGLFQRKDAERFWELAKVPPGESKRQVGGYTALAVLALLHAGQSYQDDRLRDAVEYLSNVQTEGTYAVTIRANVWATLPPRFHEQLAADARWLLEGFSQTNGGWDYVQNPRAKYHDNSIRQFGALALWEAAKRDIKIDRQVWQRLETAYVSSQKADGGWNYKGDDATTGSMTAAGLATLFITQDLLHSNDAVKLGSRAAEPHEAAIARGMQWMDKNFSATANPGKNAHFFYYLYGVERVGLAGGYRRFGGHDWFREGAAEMIDRLCKWNPATESFSLRSTAEAPTKTDEIAFTLLFLSRGRVPVAMNKLEFAGAWNNRPRDAANLTRWIGENSETELSWQIVSMQDDPRSWLDAPMVYAASDEALPWMKSLKTDVHGFVREAREYLKRREAGDLGADEKPPARPDVPELNTLKQYLDLGGMIFAANEGGNRSFADSIEKAGMLMYPQYEWRALPEEHWAYTVHTPVKGRRVPLRGLSNGVRELIILAPGGDLPATFQKADTKEEVDYHTISNVYFYKSELNRPSSRLGHGTTAAAASTTKRSAVLIARAVHEGNWKPEPLALEEFATGLAAERGIDAKIIDRPLAKIHELSPQPALVVVSGIDEHAFSEAQIAAIKSYVAAGGVILFETTGGVGGFAASAERMAESAFGKPVESALRTRVISGEALGAAPDLTQVEFRPFSMQVFGTRETAPRLRCMTVNQKRGPQVFFSREDISNALLDQPCWGISGYSAKSARQLMGNLVQHAIAK